MTINVSGECSLGLAQQTTWGIGALDNAAFTEIKVDKPIITPDIKSRIDPVDRGVRYQDIEDINADQIGSLPKFSVNLSMLRKTDIAFLLYSFFQQVTEGASTPFSKAFTFHTTQPDFSANAGAFFTAILKSPIASSSWKIIDAICTKLNFKVSPGGLLSCTADFTGRGAVSFVSNPSGTWTIGADNFYNFEDIARMTYNFAGAISPQIGALEIELTQDIITVGQDATAHACKNFGLTKKGGTVKGSLIYDANTKLLEGYSAAGTPGTMRLGWGNATAGTVDGDLDFAISTVLKPGSVKLNHADALMVDFEGIIAGDVSAALQPITVTLADAVDRTW